MLLLLVACGDFRTLDADALEPKHGGDTDPGTADSDSAHDTSRGDSPPPDTGGGAGGGGSTSDPCIGLAPSTPAGNSGNLAWCLTNYGHVDLGTGTFEVDAGVTLPAGTSLTGSGATLRLVGSSTNFLVTVTGSDVVSGLVLDANDMNDPTNGSVVQVTGSNNTLSSLWIGNASGPAAGRGTAGIYFIDAAGTGNVASGVELTNLFYGAIFVGGLPAGSGNRITGSTVHDTMCDGVTFAGYGELVDSTLWHSGYDCENGPIPGASVYCLDNTAGGLVSGNTMYDDCGNIVDIDGCAGFELSGNTLRDPGYQWEGWAPWCSGSTLALIDVSGFTITGNDVENNERPQNRVDVYGDSNWVFSDDSAYDQLPAGGETVLAFWLAQRHTSPGAVEGNVISDNSFRASCSSGCSGLGYYTSRSTGYDASAGWSASTTNYYTANDPFGSNVGSRRCGGNWFAANSTCTEGAADADCNTDDYQHTADWMRTDGCYTW